MNEIGMKWKMAKNIFLQIIQQRVSKVFLQDNLAVYQQKINYITNILYIMNDDLKQ
ncbi:hypothetical protein pb186bvf_019514 [Paramecium bursaria]